MWILLIIGSALTLGLYDVCKKHAVDANGVLPALWLSTAIGTAAVAAAQAATGALLPACTLALQAADLLLLKSLMVAASWIAAWYAMRALPITIVAPIRGSQPVWVVAGALLFFREAPSALQWAGIGVTIGGYFLFSMIGQQEGIRFRADRGVALIFLATVIGAAAALYDKYLLQPRHLSPEAVQLGFQVGMVAMIGLAWVGMRAAGWRRTPFAWRWTVAAVGLLLVLSDWLYFTALAQPDALLSVLSPIRRTNAIVAFLVGGPLFCDANRRAKGLALLVVVLGAVLLCL